MKVTSVISIYDTMSFSLRVFPSRQNFRGRQEI